MAGIGQPDVVPLSAGTTAQPLVSPMNPVVTPDAVRLLVDAVHNGAINTLDIANRIGSVAQAEKKANLAKLGEYVSPEAIQARMDAHRLASAQANLQTEQAQAAEPLVQPQADLLSTQISRQRAATVYGEGGISAIQAIGPWYGISMDQFKNPDGTVDFQKASKAGNEIAAQNTIVQNLYERLAPKSTQEFIDTAGVKHIAQLNAAGEDVSKPVPGRYAGSPTYWHYVNQLNTMMPKTHPLRAVVPQVDQSDEAVPSPGAPVHTNEVPHAYVTPATQGKYMAEYVQSLKDKGWAEEDATKQALKLDPSMLQAFVDDKYNSPDVQPVAAAAPVPIVQPIVEPATLPAAALGTPTYGGPAVAPAQANPEAKKALETLADVDAYYKAKPVYDGFADAARQSLVSPNGVSDLSLAEGFSKLLDANSTLKEFKFDALQKAIPWLEKIKDAPAIIEQEHMFPPEARQRIIQSGLQMINQRERSLVPRFRKAEQLNPGTLDDEQRQILEGVSYSKRMGLGEPEAPAASATLTTLPSGKRIRFVPQ